MDYMINASLPILPHEHLDADRCDCLFIRLDGDQAEIVLQ
jgi:hypothetical protein